MKKQLDTRVMENELRSGSAFFRAVPPRQNQPEKEQASPPPTERKADDSNTATSPPDGLSEIKLPKKEVHLAPVMPLEEGQIDRPTNSSTLQRKFPAKGRRSSQTAQ